MNATIDNMSVNLGLMDFTLLKSQKTILVKMMMEEGNRITDEETDVIEGIVNLIDVIQDAAVDTYGLDRHEVFNLTKTEEE